MFGVDTAIIIMPLYDLLFKASVEGIQKLEPMQDRLWHLDVQCSQCGEQSEKTLVVDPREEMELPSGGGYANMVAKCWKYVVLTRSIEELLKSVRQSEIIRLLLCCLQLPEQIFH